MYLPLIYGGLYIVSLLIGIVAWYYIWFKPGYCVIPQEESNLQELLSPTKLFRANTLKDFLKGYGKLFYKLDPTYWAATCGLDTYAYLYFQRRMLVMVVFFFLIVMGVRAFYILSFPEQTHGAGFFNTKTEKIDFTSNMELLE
jgi:hypothetical protein